MGRANFLVLGIVSFSLMAAQSSHAFGPVGHRIVARIAEFYLNPKAKMACDVLLEGMTLSDVASWADDNRPDPKFAGFEPLHFANIPTGVLYQDAPKKPDGDVVIATQVLIQYLKTGDRSELSKVPALNIVERAMALKLLVHWVGDIHQPLHLEDYDQGGNKFKVSFMSPTSITTMHPVWDEKMIGLAMYNFSEYADFLQRSMKPSEEELEAWRNLDAVDWINESLPLQALIYVFPDKQPDPVPDQDPVPFVGYSYVLKNRPILEKNMVKGGIRLAYVINYLFGKK